MFDNLKIILIHENEKNSKAAETKTESKDSQVH